MKKYIQKLLTLLAVCAGIWSTISVHAQNNLLANGDFSAGNTGFTSDNTYVPSGQAYTARIYAIRTVPSSFNTIYNPFGDHTTGQGNMMLAHATGPYHVAWQETVSIASYKNYIFSGWARASYGLNRPLLTAYINGVWSVFDAPVSSSTMDVMTGSWQPFSVTWYSGAATNVTLSLVDNAGGVGDDLALDDLSFRDTGYSPTSFTYQGRLNSGTNVANGSYDMVFSLFSTNVGGTVIASNYVEGVFVNNGIFTTLVDLGPGAFDQSATWLEISVATNVDFHSLHAFFTLAPRQPVTPTPHAMYADHLSSSAQLIIDGLTIQPNPNGAANVILGSTMNFVSNGVVGAAIGGGGGGVEETNSVTANYGTVGGGAHNTADGYSVVGGGYNNTASPFSTVGGGFRNTANGLDSTVGGGLNNTASGQASTVGGGDHNYTSYGAVSSTVGGGSSNSASAPFSTVSGGYNNSTYSLSSFSTVGGGDHNNASGNHSTVAGGSTNYASGLYSTVAGGNGNTAGGVGSFAAGQNAQALHDGSFVWADNSAGSFASTGTNQFLIRASGNVGIGTSAPNYPLTVEADAANADMISWRNSGNELGRLGQSSGAGFMGVSTATGFKVGLRAAGNSFFTGGNVGIGTNSPQTQLHVVANDGAQLRLQNTTGVYYNIYAEAGSGGNLLFVPGAGTYAYLRHTDGAWLSGSDERLKRDITALGGVLDRVLQLRPVAYHFRSEPEATSRSLGLIAQEVEPLFPEVVGEHDGQKALAYSELVPVTIGAIQELNKKLEQQNAELQARLEKLEKLMQQKHGGGQ